MAATGSQTETKMMTDVSRLHIVPHPLTQTADRRKPIYHQARLTAQGSALKKAVIPWDLSPEVSFLYNQNEHGDDKMLKETLENSPAS